MDALLANKRQQPHVPELFKQIGINHAELAAIIREQAVTPFSQAGELLSQRRMYRRAAEKMLKWNEDKGNKAR